MHTFSKSSYYGEDHSAVFLEYTPCVLEHPGPLIILLHGLGGSTNSFQPLVPDLSISHPLLRLDLPGLGRSAVRPSLKFDDLVDLVHDISQKASPRAPVILVGHSLGGLIAMHFAGRFPDRVKALAVIGPNRARADGPTHMTRLANLARQQGTEFMADATVENNVSPYSSDLVRAFVREVMAAQSAEGYAVMCEAMAALTRDPDYAKIECPTILVAGADDRISSVETAREVAKLIEAGGNGNVALATVNSGHQHVLEDTTGVLKAVRRLLAKVRS